jgi:DMSO reductase anchor subunit
MYNKPMTVTQLLPSKKQTEWRWPAAANFILGGAGSGFYALVFITLIAEKGRFHGTLPLPFGFLGPLLVVIGLGVLVTEAGRPLRGRFLMHRLQSAWMSREILACCFFILSVALDYVFPHPAFKLFAFLSAVVFMFSQGFIAYSARAVSAWNDPVILLFFITSGLASGAGVALLSGASDSRMPLQALVLGALICAILNLTVWMIYPRWSGAEAFRSAFATQKRFPAIFFAVVAGHLLSILLLVLILAASRIGSFGLLPVILSIGSGAALIFVVVVQKSYVFLAAGYTRAIVL